MGGDFYSILSTAEVTSGALQQTLAIIHQSTGQISKESNQNVENVTSVDEPT